jgi:hypothetical protein
MLNTQIKAQTVSKINTINKVKLAIVDNWEGIRYIKMAFEDFDKVFSLVLDDMENMNDAILCEAMRFITSWGSDACEHFRNDSNIVRAINELKKAIWCDMEVFYEANYKWEARKVFGNVYMGGHANY